MIKKRIHCFISSLSGGGAEHQMAYLCSFLAEDGYDVTLITLHNKPDKYDVSPLVKRFCFNYNQSSTKLQKLIKRIYIYFYFLFLKTDCVISYLIGPNAQVLRPMKLRPRTKVIVSERNFICWKLSKREDYIYGKLYNRANYIVPNSYAMANFLKKHNPTLISKVHTIINYTDIDKYVPYPLPLGSTLQVGVFARYQKQKNYERFAQMLKIVNKQMHRPFHVHWYGDKEVREAQLDLKNFQDLISIFGISDIITLHGFVKDVPSVMKSLDIICLPSIYEGFSNSLAEAICCGKPVLAGDVSDNSTMVKDGLNGYLFNPYDVRDMTKVFLKCINMQNCQIEEMSKESRNTAETLFSKETFLHKYIELIEE